MGGNPSNSLCPLPAIVGAMMSLSSSRISAASSDRVIEMLPWTPISPPRLTLQMAHEIDQPAVDHA
jgi:hypothetical protein